MKSHIYCKWKWIFENMIKLNALDKYPIIRNKTRWSSVVLLLLNSHPILSACCNSKLILRVEVNPFYCLNILKIKSEPKHLASVTIMLRSASSQIIFSQVPLISVVLYAVFGVSIEMFYSTQNILYRHYCNHLWFLCLAFRKPVSHYSGISNHRQLAFCSSAWSGWQQRNDERFPILFPFERNPAVDSHHNSSAIRKSDVIKYFSVVKLA